MTDGIVVSRITERGVAANAGMKLYDQIIQVCLQNNPIEVFTSTPLLHVYFYLEESSKKQSPGANHKGNIVTIQVLTHTKDLFMFQRQFHRLIFFLNAVSN